MKNFIRRFPLAISALVLLAAALGYLRFGPSFATVSADKGFSNASVNGSYGIVVNKWTSDPNTIPEEDAEASVGVITFDGAGNLFGSFTNVHPQGTVNTATLSGTYSVNSDGTGAASVTTSFGETDALAFVLVDRAKEIRFVQTTSSSANDHKVFVGNAREQLK